MLKCFWSWCVNLLTYCGRLPIAFSVFSKTACLPHDMGRSIFLNAFKYPRQRESWEIVMFIVFNHLFMPAVHIKCVKLQVIYICNLSYVFRQMFTVFRETIIGRILCKLEKNPLYLCLPKNDEHSSKHVGEIIYIDNLKLYTFNVQLLIYIYRIIYYSHNARFNNV
jgi:hypothetical protein